MVPIIQFLGAFDESKCGFLVNFLGHFLCYVVEKLIYFPSNRLVLPLEICKSRYLQLIFRSHPILSELLD